MQRQRTDLVFYEIHLFYLSFTNYLFYF